MEGGINLGNVIVERDACSSIQSNRPPSRSYSSLDDTLSIRHHTVHRVVIAIIFIFWKNKNAFMFCKILSVCLQ